MFVIRRWLQHRRHKRQRRRNSKCKLREVLGWYIEIDGQPNEKSGWLALEAQILRLLIVQDKEESRNTSTSEEY